MEEDLRVPSDDGLGRPRAGGERRAAGDPAPPRERRLEHRRRHVEATRLALAQLPRHLRRRVLVRTDSGGGTHGFLTWLTAPSRRLHYSAGMTITEDMQEATLKVPAGSWTPAYDGDGQVRDGAWVADITGLLDLSSWPGCGSSSGKSARTRERSCGSPTSTATGSPPSP